MPRVNRRSLVLLAGLGSLAALPTLHAQTTTPAAPCTAPENRQFDFWLGEWNVQTPGAKPSGQSSITLILNKCVLLENYRGAKGFQGESFNIYDASTGRWHQTWVDVTGGLLQLDGKLVGNEMVLEGRSQAPGGGTIEERITWSPLADGKVRQLWEQSSDGGTTWTVQFDGMYTKK